MRFLTGGRRAACSMHPRGNRREPKPAFRGHSNENEMNGNPLIAAHMAVALPPRAPPLIYSFLHSFAGERSPPAAAASFPLRRRRTTRSRGKNAPAVRQTLRQSFNRMRTERTYTPLAAVLRLALFKQQKKPKFPPVAARVPILADRSCRLFIYYFHLIHAVATSALSSLFNCPADVCFVCTSVSSRRFVQILIEQTAAARKN